MNCTDFELAFQERLDARQLELTDDLRAHTATCADCRAFWQSQSGLMKATSDWTNPAEPPQLLQSVLNELTSDTPRVVRADVPVRTPSRAGIWVATCSTAALLLAAVLLGIAPTPNGSPLVPSEVVITPPAEPDAPMMSGLLTGVRTEYAELSQQTTRVLDEWSELPRTPTLIPAFAEPNAAPAGDSPTWLRLDRPVSDRVGQAFDFLWDAVPQSASRSS